MGGVLHEIKCPREWLEHNAPFLGQMQSFLLSEKQQYTHALFQCLDLVTDSSLGNIQLVRRTGKTQCLATASKARMEFRLSVFRPIISAFYDPD